MEFQEFKFLYQDYKNQIKHTPRLTNLLTTTQKSTKKLQCISLYSLVQKRQLDLQIQEDKIYQDIKSIFKTLYNIRNQSKNQNQNVSNLQQLSQLQSKLNQIKQTNMETYDLLARQDQLLTQQVQLAQYFLGDQDHQNQIKEVDQDQQLKQDNINLINQQKKQDSQNTFYDINQGRYQQLKKQIQDIQKKISKINNGRGKWLATDHNDFVKIYNKCSGNAKKIVEQGIKFLGMTNAQIMDHLQVYDQYIQLEKQKKIVTYQYKQLKFMQHQDQKQKQDIKKQQAYLKKKEKDQIKIEEQIKKKQMIKQFKEKRNQEKRKMIEQAQKQKINKFNPSIPLSVDKKKQIIQRNKKFIETKQQNFKRGKIGGSLSKPVNITHNNQNKQIKITGIGSNKSINKTVKK